jgi:hypothetical protein
MTRWHQIPFLALALLAPTSTLAQQGEPFLSSTRQAYRVAVELRAVPRGQDTAAGRMAGLGIPAEELVEVKGPFLILRRPTVSGTAVGTVAATAAARPAAASAVATVDRTRVHPVAVNTASGRLGILSGIVVARLRNPDDAAALAQANGLELDYVAVPIRCAFFRVPDGRDVVAAATALARDARVELTSPEVSETFRVPN